MAGLRSRVGETLELYYKEWQLVTPLQTDF